VRKILCTVFGFWLCGLLAASGALALSMADGTTLTADIVSFNDDGIILRTADEKYTDRLPWLKFSQQGLLQLYENTGNPKVRPFVVPFILPRATAAEQPPRRAVKINEVSRLDPPAPASIFGALFSSPVTLLALLLVYAANLYAGYEVARYRSKPVELVMGVSAVLPIAGPAIFLSMMPAPAAAEAADAAPAAPAEMEPHRFAVPGSTPQPEDIHIATASWQPPGAGAHNVEPQVFQRGQFMFNRRFFETRFPGFFGSIRGEDDRYKELVVKATKGEFIVQRITRIGANDAHFEVVKGGVHQEVIVPFADMQEVRVNPKAA
jgi:hypothetical protein